MWQLDKIKVLHIAYQIQNNIAGENTAHGSNQARQGNLITLLTYN